MKMNCHTSYDNLVQTAKLLNIKKDYEANLILLNFLFQRRKKNRFHDKIHIKIFLDNHTDEHRFNINVTRM
jgi:hypothetical protein